MIFFSSHYFQSSIVLNLLLLRDWCCFSVTICSLRLCCSWVSWWSRYQLGRGSWLGLFLLGFLRSMRNPCRWDAFVNVWCWLASCGHFKICSKGSSKEWLLYRKIINNIQTVNKSIALGNPARFDLHLYSSYTSKKFWRI